MNVMRIPAALAALCASALLAGDGTAAQFSFRASRAGAPVRDLAASSGGGGGFALILGQEPLRIRFRMDGDTFPGTGDAGSTTTYGVGAEALVLFPTGTALRPYVSAGPGFQQWKAGTPSAPQSRTWNKGAFRVEAGVWYDEHFSFFAGVLAGPLQPGRTAVCPYLGVSFIH